MGEFKVLMAEVLEEETVDINDDITAFDSWDSLTILSIIAMVQDEYNVEIDGEEIENSQTIKGLKDLIKSKSKIEIT